ncbi:hypothetical protein EJ08DRAFT_665465 [Tothia fuscella]|uniref:Double-strand-break repair protein rad21 n=1 Tax=Tothia fuscella TaxID=1048955 RepID=A0A9P4NGT6_9PEZI|nr:hypothetical protein EJ08DRAFT_665465 [Tothia fuscella]
MFYSDTLLSKTGPLARVWLAANMERRLSKKDCVNSDLEDSIQVMVNESQAPMALRLSGQLLLGVVRIYKRKTGYLLDDCNEALLKIKMAFRPGGNVDLPADQSHTANPESIMLPETLTEIELFQPLPDASILLADPQGFHFNDENDLNWGTQDLLTDSVEQPRNKSVPRPLEDYELDLDMGFDLPGGPDESIEMGRRAPEPLNDGPSFLEDIPLEMVEDLPPRDPSILPAMDHMDDTIGGFRAFDGPTLGLGDTTSKTAPRDRHSLSPFSDIRPSVERELEATFQQNNDNSIYEPQDETVVEAAQRVKRRKILQMDVTTELPNSVIKEQQQDRSKILKPSNFLPRDPMLLALLNMQKNGGFISSILGDGRSTGWAPELRNILSVEVIRRSGERKRKRDSGIADMGSDEDGQSPKAPPLHFEEDEFTAGNAGDLGLDNGIDEEIPADGPVRPPSEEQGGDFGPGSPAPFGDHFDDTTIPLLHPADAGPISQGTQHAVHLLREQFGREGETSPSKRQKASVLFQDLLPEKRTSRRDATKMFFEVLVLATKDAVKVEQGSKELGGALRIRAKRGLYGSWAEERAAGSMETAGTQVQEVALVDSAPEEEEVIMD